MDPDDDFLQQMPPFLSLEEAAQIFERDLPTLCDAQLAQVLAEVQKLGALPIAEALATLARRELARRRAVNRSVPGSLPWDFPTNRS